MSGPEGVMALVLAQTAAGALFLAFLTPLWNEVKRGFFKLTGSLVALTLFGAWGTISIARTPGSAAGAWAWQAALWTGVATVAWVGLLFARQVRGARIVGFATVAGAGVLLAACAAVAEAAWPLALFQSAAAALFLGAVMDGLLLGHWYLTDRGLSRTPINRFANLLLVGVAAEAVAVVTMGFGPNEGSESFNPLLTSAGLSSWIALGMVVATALIATLIKATLRGTRATAVQSATGFFYLAVLTAFTAALAAMVGYLPAA